MFIIRLCRVVAEKMPHVLKRIFEVFHKIFSYTPSVIPDIYMSVKFLAECKKFQKNNKISALGSVCRKFTHFPSVKFPGLEICECKKNDKYQVLPKAVEDDCHRIIAGIMMIVMIGSSDSEK